MGGSGNKSITGIRFSERYGQWTLAIFEENPLPSLAHSHALHCSISKVFQNLQKSKTFLTGNLFDPKILVENEVFFFRVSDKGNNKQTGEGEREKNGSSFIFTEIHDKNWLVFDDVLELFCSP